MPTFPEGTNSYLSRNLNTDVWNELKDKSDSYGFTFKQAIFSGCKNLDSGVGMYAGSPDSYPTFSPLFKPTIDQYHKRQPGQTQPRDMDYQEFARNFAPFSQTEETLIVSTRIRLARNLEGFPLVPGLSREQRLEVESLIVEACENFKGDLKGTYYSLSNMTDADATQLREDHFLFKEGDRFLEAAGSNRDWPEGRGIFHNDEKTFLIWVNEEDQIRIISMQMGADFAEVFSRLARASEEIEKIVKFAYYEKLGYLTACPTNLGTGLRASVHIWLPQLGTRMDELKAIADEYNVQIRGVHGEHSESDNHIYDVSNKIRMGRSEVQLLQDLYKGIKAIVEAETYIPDPSGTITGSINTDEL